MIRCTKCDTVNPDNAVFCSNCASFLEWTGEKVDAATVAAASSAPVAKPADAESPIPPAVKPEPHAEAKPESQVKAKPEPQAEAKREPEADAQPEPEPAPGRVPEPAETPVQDVPAQSAAVISAASSSVTEPAEPAAAKPARRRRRKPKKEETTAAPVIDIKAALEPAAKPEPAPPPPPAEPAPLPAVRPWVAPPPPPPPPPFRRPGEPVVHHLDETPPELRTGPEEQPAPATPPADKPKPTFRFRAAAAASTTTAAAAAGAPAGAGAPAPTAAGPAASGQPAARPPSTQPPSSQPASGSQPAARRPTAEAEQPASRKPTAEVAPRPRPRPSQVQPLVADQPIKPGDLVCSNCGTGNDPARRFCRRCGTSLATAVVARKPPWYRRLFRRNQRAYAAGERPGAMGETGQPRRSPVKPVALVLVLVLVVGLIAGYLFDGGFKRTVDGLIGSVGNMVDTTTHQANLAFDGDIATYWLADPSGGTPTANVPLTDTVNLLKVLVHSGAGVGPEFERYGRPKTIEFEFPSLPPVRKVLADDPAAQEFDLKVPAVGTYIFRIIDFYPASDPNQKLVALREVELTASAQP